VRLDLDTGRATVLRSSSTLALDPGYLSAPRSVEFPTEGGVTAFGFHYPPCNRDFTAPDRERPPLLVVSHGGPTSSARNVLSLGIQFWTSRGFAVLDVDYGGSTGYGRAYRQRLDGLWGVVDVDDCVNGARYLASRGLADPSRLGIRGGSAGGYTTLAALTFRQLFRAGASYYGVSDLGALARDTHKFESRYLDRLVGPYPAREDIYRERSPINFSERISCPLILFQGLEDKVVPPDQAERMLAAALAKGLPVAYLAFEGEQHGFRKAETIRRTLEAELYFYGKVWGFEPADRIEPLEIRNLAGGGASPPPAR
jgi:dipeptidyl aminopeptidase/acylaminoacyl peptidase